jgi:hypothetical protein
MHWRRISGLSVGLLSRRAPVKLPVVTEQVDKTDSVNSSELDRGFQVLLTSYPEAQMLLDYSITTKTFFCLAQLSYDEVSLK